MIVRMYIVDIPVGLPFCALPIINASYLQFSHTPMLSLLVQKSLFPQLGVLEPTHWPHFLFLEDEVMDVFPALGFAIGCCSFAS